MPEVNNSSWIKKNVTALVTWSLVLLTAAVAWGNTTAELGATQAGLKELRVDAKEWAKDRAQIKSDLRVNESKVLDLAKRVSKVLEAVDRVENTVTRLEAVAKIMSSLRKQTPPPPLRNP